MVPMELMNLGEDELEPSTEHYGAMYLICIIYNNDFRLSDEEQEVY